MDALPNFNEPCCNHSATHRGNGMNKPAGGYELVVFATEWFARRSTTCDIEDLSTAVHCLRLSRLNPSPPRQYCLRTLVTRFEWSIYPLAVRLPVHSWNICGRGCRVMIAPQSYIRWTNTLTRVAGYICVWTRKK